MLSIQTMKAMILLTIFITVLCFSVSAMSKADMTTKRWNIHSAKFIGPRLKENGFPNPFTDFVLECVYTHELTGEKLYVPGYFAADGNAAMTGASAGRVWICRFTPARTGVWHLKVSFRAGEDAVFGKESIPTAFDGATISIFVEENNVQEPDLRSKGRLQYVGQRYFQFANGEYMMKLGTNTPENLLGYGEFDNSKSPKRLTYSRHVRDWTSDDPTWGSNNNRGKGLIGAINYLHKQGVNSLFAMLMTVKGDSKGDAHPWISPTDMTRFDVSKLDQWQIVFEHAGRKGLALNLAFLETENENLFEYEAGISLTSGFANTRKLFYREMIARFSHNLGFTMTLGEENGWSDNIAKNKSHVWSQANTDEQRSNFTNFLRSLDPYDSPILIHTFPQNKTEVYDPILSGATSARVDAASLQAGVLESIHRETKYWVSRSESFGRQWVVSTDEFGRGVGGLHGVALEKFGVNYRSYRARFCWANIMAGGSGIEVFSASVDQSLDDFTQLQSAWTYFSRARALFRLHSIPFWALNSDDVLVSVNERGSRPETMYCLAKRSELYVIYAGEQAKSIHLNMTHAPDVLYHVRWYSPRVSSSYDLMRGENLSIRGGKDSTYVGRPPNNPNLDWVVIVSRSLSFDQRPKALTVTSGRNLIADSLKTA